MTRTDRIKTRLQDHLAPERLEIVNESHLHSGHGDHFDGTGETHLRIRIVATAFEGMNRLARHRAITGLLADELAGGLHALAIEASAPGEPTRR